jgi:hypothetical protein
MDESHNIRRASDQLRSLEEIQPWLGIPWSRAGRRINSIDNGDARRLGDCDDARRANENPSSHSDVGLQMGEDNLRDLLGRLARRKVADIL